jgi:hypothetical protein
MLRSGLAHTAATSSACFPLPHLETLFEVVLLWACPTGLDGRPHCIQEMGVRAHSVARGGEPPAPCARTSICTHSCRWSDPAHPFHLALFEEGIPCTQAAPTGAKVVWPFILEGVLFAVATELAFATGWKILGEKDMAIAIIVCIMVPIVCGLLGWLFAYVNPLVDGLIYQQPPPAPPPPPQGPPR